jgi:hypothetical protein
MSSVQTVLSELPKCAYVFKKLKYNILKSTVQNSSHPKGAQKNRTAVVCLRGQR